MSPDFVAAMPARRVDYEYRRNGTGNLFTTVEPLAGWRHVEVTERRKLSHIHPIPA